MQISAKFAILFAAVAYGSISVAALPIYSQYDTRELSVDFNTRDLSYLDVRDFEDFHVRDGVTTPSAPPAVAPVSASNQPNSAPSSGSTHVAPPPRLTHEEHASHRAALADPTHPDHQKSLDRQKTVHAHHQSVLADPTHPHHAKAKAFEEKKGAFAKLHKEALNDPKHPLHQHAKAHEAQKSHKAALADPTHPHHAAAKEKETKRKAFHKVHKEALSDPNHPLHQVAKTHEAKKQAKKEHTSALSDPNHPHHLAAIKEHQGHGGVGATEAAHPHPHEHTGTSAGPASAGATLHRRDYY